MKYETPKLSTLMSAIDAIQATSPSSKLSSDIDSSQPDVTVAAYADWEE